MTVLAEPRIGEAVLLDYPIRLGTQQSDRFADVVRELELIALAAESGSLPPERRHLMELSHRLASPYIRAVFHQLWQQRVAARSEGLDRIDLRYPLIPQTPAIALAWQDAMDQVDDACERDELLILPPSPDLRRLRRWQIDELLRQFNGEAPTPWPGPW
jgi:hypothetical protein